MAENLTQDRLLEVLRYNPVKGDFKWKSLGTGKKRYNAGCIEVDGYRVIKIDGKLYKAHRLAWLYMHGYWPENAIDHINQEKTDNRIINLREISKSCNMRNTKKNKVNTSGVKGVSWHKRDKRWVSHIQFGGKKKSLGSHKCFVEAVYHRYLAEQLLNWGDCESNSSAKDFIRREPWKIKP